METISIDCIDGEYRIVDSEGSHDFKTINELLGHIAGYEYPSDKVVIPIVILENGDDRLFIWGVKPEELISVCQELANG